MLVKDSKGGFGQLRGRFRRKPRAEPGSKGALRENVGWVG